MNKYLPVIIFVICIAIAVILAWTTPPLWPAAVAIALAGAALALALHAQTGGEAAYLVDEITALQEANADLRADLDRSHSMIDELADVVEQIAAVTVDGGNGASHEQVEALSAQIADLRGQPQTPATDPDVLARLASVEAQLTARSTDSDATLTLTDTLATAAPSLPNRDAGRLRSLIARVSPTPEAADPAPEAEPADPLKIVLTPVFALALGAPVAFILGVKDAETPEIVPGLLRHAALVAGELEEAERDVRLFVRLSPMTLEHLTVRRDILAAIDASPALQRRLTLLTPQEGFNETVQNTLAAVAERGCMFAMDAVRDWSINLAALARAGLSFIVVDGIAMARSAEEQGGDPRRLAQALRMHEISLIGGNVAARDDFDSVRRLEPALVTGEGLGKSRVVEATR